MVLGFRPTPGGGGTEKHVYELTRGLLGRGVEVDLICEDQSYLPDPVNELRDHIIGVRPESLHAEGKVRRYREKTRRFAELLRPEEYDLIHCHSHYGYDVVQKLDRLDRRPAVVSTFHLTPLGQLERFRELGIPEPEDTAIERAVAGMEEMVARLSDRCIAVSRIVGQEVVRFYGVPPERVRVIYNWYDPAIFGPGDRREARRRLGLDPDGRYLLYIGNFTLHRGKLLAEAMRTMQTDAILLVAHPEADAEIEEEFGERIRFVGYVPPEDMALYYSAADLQCFPTVYSAFGLVQVEGMACGCPPVVFDFPAMNEVVTEESGYLVGEATPEAYAAALERGLAEGGRKREAAIRRAREFDMEAQIDKVVDLYNEVAMEPIKRIST